MTTYTCIVRTYSYNETILREEYFKLNGIKEGKSYTEYGQLITFCNYINDKIDGQYKEYWTTSFKPSDPNELNNHILWKISTFVNGSKEGCEKEYTQYGKLKRIYVYSNNRLICELKMDNPDNKNLELIFKFLNIAIKEECDN